MPTKRHASQVGWLKSVDQIKTSTKRISVKQDANFLNRDCFLTWTCACQSNRTEKKILLTHSCCRTWTETILNLRSCRIHRKEVVAKSIVSILNENCVSIMWWKSTNDKIANWTLSIPPNCNQCSSSRYPDMTSLELQHGPHWMRRGCHPPAEAQRAAPQRGRGPRDLHGGQGLHTGQEQEVPPFYARTRQRRVQREEVQPHEDSCSCPEDYGFRYHGFFKRIEHWKSIFRGFSNVVEICKVSSGN